MNFEIVLNSPLFNPNSNIHGFFSLLASWGTIWALIATLKTVKDNKIQTKLLSNRRAIDNVFEEFKQSIERVTFSFNDSHGLHVLKGVDAILYAQYNRSLNFVKNNSNIELISDYLNHVSVYSHTVLLILHFMKDGTSFRIYENKLTSEFRFVREHVLPMLEIMHTSASNSQLSDLTIKLEEIIKEAEYVSKLSIKNGMLE